MKNIWIVVANSSHAKIYKAESVKSLKEIAHFEHPESRLPNHELVSDQQGRATDQFSSSPHTYDYKHSPKLKEKDHFAAEVSEYLEKSFHEGQFEKLYIIANTTFLSLLHHHLDKDVSNVIQKEVAKDLTLLGPNAVLDHLPPVL